MNPQHPAHPTTNQQFLNLLESTKQRALQQLSSLPSASTLTGVEFERLVVNCMLEASAGTVFEGAIEQTGDTDFPDIIIADHYGVEVKTTKKDNWKSIGNSILESSRAKSVQEIYVLFGKLGGAPDIKYRDYAASLSGIAVTHYPRYKIDIELAEGESIFDKIQSNYDTIRNSAQPIKLIREYYKGQLKPGQELWWLSDDINTATTLNPYVTPYSKLDRAHKTSILAELFALFPIVLSSSKRKYEQVMPYLITRHGVYNASMRDVFSGSGTSTVNINNQSITIPRVVQHVIDLYPSKITQACEALGRDTLERYWGAKTPVNQTLIECWLEQVQTHAVGSYDGYTLRDILSELTEPNNLRHKL